MLKLYLYADSRRNPRERNLTPAFWASIHPDYEVVFECGNDAGLADWMPVDNLPITAFNHTEIVNHAERRLNYMKYSLDGFKLLIWEFTCSDVLKLYETILKIKIYKHNFKQHIVNLIRQKYTKS